MPVVLVLLVLQNCVLKNGVTSCDTMLIIILMKIHQLGQALLDTDTHGWTHKHNITNLFSLQKEEGTLKYGHFNIPGNFLYNASTTVFNLMLQTTVSATP
jgi:hypothetical protein